MVLRPKFSVRTLFWVTLTVASFLAGTTWKERPPPEPPPEPVFVSLGEVDLPSPEDGGQVRLGIVLQVGERFASRVRSNRDRLMGAVIIQTNRSVSRSVGPIDRDQLRKDLMKICSSTIGNKIIDDVLFEEFAF